MTKLKSKLANQIILLASAYAHTNQTRDKSEHLVAEIGYLSGWLATIAEHDLTVRSELRVRLEQLGVEEASTEIVNKPKYREE